MLNGVAVAKVGHCQAIHTKTPHHAYDGVFLFVLSEQYRTLEPCHAVCTIGLCVQSQLHDVFLCVNAQSLAITHKKAHINVGLGY